MCHNVCPLNNNVGTNLCIYVTTVCALSVSLFPQFHTQINLSKYKLVGRSIVQNAHGTQFTAPV